MKHKKHYKRHKYIYPGPFPLLKGLGGMTFNKFPQY